MSIIQYSIYLLIIAGSTYLIRSVPFVLIKNQIKNRYIKTFFDYIPYTVLASMTFPAIIDSSTYTMAAMIGALVAIILAYVNQSMVRVAIAACVTVYIVECILRTYF